MANKKISELTAASEVLNSTLAAIVQAGATLKATREQLLTAGSGQNIQLQAGSGTAAAIVGGMGESFVGCLDDGSIEQYANAGATLGLQDHSSELAWSSVGDWSLLFGPLSTSFTIGFAGSPIFSIDFTNDVFTIDWPAGISITYVAGASGDWAVSAPTTIYDAIDRIAALVKTLNAGVPIP